MVANNRFDAVEFLLRNRANPNGVGVRMAGKGVPDYLSSNPLRIAEDSGLADMTKVLRSYGASLEPFIDDIRFGLCLTESQLVRLENVKQQKAKEFGLPSNYFNEQLMQVT
jgi:membrane carboxypeptidase/penicillin-binding protein PbpC